MSTASNQGETAQPALRLACVAHWLPKRSETFILDEVRALHRLHPPLKVFTLYGPWRKSLSPDLSADGLCVHRLGFRSTGVIARDIAYWLKVNGPTSRRLWREVPWRRWSDVEMAGENCWAFLCGFHLARLARADGITHLHACWANGPATGAWVASRLTGIPFSFSAWAGDMFPPDGALDDKIRDAAFVRSTCHAFVPHLQKHAGDAPDKIRVVRNGQDPARFSPAAPLFITPIKLLALGRFVAKKGFHNLLHAAAILKRAGIAFQLTLAGDGPQRRRLMRLSRRLGLAKETLFPGFVPRHRTCDLFPQCDLLVVPSVVDPDGDRDGIPNVILEALLHRIPVVATAVGGIPEVICDGETGRLISPDDPHALAAAIQDLICHPEQAMAMAERGRERVLRDYNPDRNSRALLSLIQGVYSAPGTQRL